MPPKISFLIPLFNEADHVREMLRSILELEYPTELLEVVIALAPSSDRTAAHLEDFAQQNPKLKIHVLPNRAMNTAVGRNLCLEAATGELVMNFSGHAIADANLLAVLVSKIDELPGDIVGVGCGICSTSTSSWLGSAIATVLSSPLGGVRTVDSSYNATRDGPARSIAFTLYKAQALRQIGGFDTDFWCGQDAEINLRLAQQGYRIWFTPNTGVQHQKRTRVTDFVRQMYRYGVARAKLTKKYPRSLRFVFLLPSVFLLAAVAGIVASCFSNLALWITLSVAVLFVLSSFVSIFSAGGGIGTTLISPLLYFVLYISYGLGFLRGWLP